MKDELSKQNTDLDKKKIKLKADFEEHKETLETKKNNFIDKFE